ncbi:MAG: hypothetical protein J6T10_21800 [Methanobrevibacter sp.]|nr:hypothetical protein [Methanobrevibacter sp.]
MGKNSGKNNAKLPDIETFIKAGIDPRTRLPLKMVQGKPDRLPTDILALLRIIDEQDAVNKGTWFNLPSGITSQELERLLYYKGQLCFFYMKDLDKFFFMPYALDGSIDFYGRFNRIHPIPFSEGTEGEDKKPINSALNRMIENQRNVLSQMKLTCVYEPVLYEEDIKKYDMMNTCCVLLHDYTKQLPQLIVPRKNLQEPLLKVMADLIPYMRTALISSTGISGIKVQDADEALSVEEGALEVETAAKTGKIWVALQGKIDFQELTSKGMSNAPEQFMLAMQSLDNLRLSTYGIDNGGLFEKKVQELNAEAAINGGPIGLVQQDYVSIRQNFCNIVNSIWGLGIWYEPSQNITNADIDGDGLMYDRDTAPIEEGGNDYESNNA